MNKKLGRFCIGLAVIGAGAAVWMTGAVLSFAKSDRVCSGVTIAGIKVGGLTKSAAEGKLQTWAREKLQQKITLTALGSRWQGTIADFGVNVAWKDAVDQAYGIGRDGNILNRAICVLSSGEMGKSIDVKTAVSLPKLEKVIDKVADAINRPHKDAKLNIVDGRFEIIQDSCGIELDRKRALSLVSSALQQGTALVTLPAQSDRPDVTAQDAAKVDSLLVKFSTSYNPAKADRTHNLSLAAGAINGTIIKPGGVFSYNDIVGQRVLSRGYRNAIIYIKGRLEEGVGGGICQVSSTLYNAVLYSGLKIVERSHHSRTVPYVKPGRDATVAYGARDFRFKNTLSSPICIIAYTGAARLTVDVYGSSQDKRDVEVYTSQPKYIPQSPNKTVFDRKLAAGETKFERGSKGVSVTVYRKKISPQGSSVVEVVSRDKYAPQPSITSVGPARSAKIPVTKPVSVSSAENTKPRAD